MCKYCGSVLGFESNYRFQYCFNYMAEFLFLNLSNNIVTVSEKKAIPRPKNGCYYFLCCTSTTYISSHYSKYD